MFSILSAIAATSKRTEKIAILKQQQDNLLFQKVVEFALSPKYEYFLKDVPTRIEPTGLSAMMGQEPISLNDAIDKVVDNLAGGKVRGTASKQLVSDLLTRLSEEDAEVLTRIIKKDLRCGVSVKTINAAWGKDWIYVPPYQRCSACNRKNLDNIKYPAIIQTKMDGMFLNGISDYHEQQYLSRNGKELPIHSETNLADEIHIHLDGNVLTGELLFRKPDGELMTREESNGVAHSDNFEDMLSNAVLVVWDMLTVEEFDARESSRGYITRFKELEKKLQDKGLSSVMLCEYKIVNNEQEAWEYYYSQIALGNEGAVLKNLDALWKDNTSKDMVKMKEEKRADLRVVGYNPAEIGSKYEGGIGSLICETSCGQLQVGVAGLSDEQRGIRSIKDVSGNILGYEPIPDFDLNRYQNDIVDVTYNAIIKDKDTGMYSLFLPRCTKSKGQLIIRDDKDEADSLADLQEKEIGG